MTVEGRRSRATEAFFGRRKGRPMSPFQQVALDQGLRRYAVDLDAPSPSDLTSLFEADVADVRLEIGFGGGEHLLHEAAAYPGTGFIGVEPFVNSMAKLMGVLAEAPLGNLRVHDDDATQLLDWLPDASLSGIDLLYPDPWPKKKHWKRRFVSPENLGRFARVMKSGGRFRFASDIDTYINWTLLACREQGEFLWQAQDARDWDTPYPGWPGTRYEAKALREKRRPCYLTFRRR